MSDTLEFRSTDPSKRYNAKQVKRNCDVFCHHVSVEGLKVVEIEKCKNDLKKLRDEMTSRGGGR